MALNKSVTLIGSGNIATVFGRLLFQKGFQIKQVYSKQFEHAQILANELNAIPVSQLASLNKDSDIYILAVKDDAIERIVNELEVGDKLVFHTAGSIEKDCLKQMSTRHGVIWPMIMVRKDLQQLEGDLIVYDGNDPSVCDELALIAQCFSSNILQADDRTRLKMHLMAAFISNFSNHIYHLAENYCEQSAIPFELFHGIMMHTVQRAIEKKPSEVQAGPAFRNDQVTIEKHLKLLADNSELKNIYELLTKSLIHQFHPNLD